MSEASALSAEDRDLLQEVGLLLVDRFLLARDEAEERKIELQHGGGSFAAYVRAKAKADALDAIADEIATLITSTPAPLPAPGGAA